MSNFFRTSELRSIDHQEFDLNVYASNSLKRSLLEVDLEYPKVLRELHNDYPLSPDKIDNTKKLVMLKSKVTYVLHYENLQFYLRLGLKLEKNTSHLRNQSITMVTTI